MAVVEKTIVANSKKGYHKFTLTLSVDTAQDQDPSLNTSLVGYEVTLSPIENTGVHDWDYPDTDPFVCTYMINGVSTNCTLRSYDGVSTISLASGTTTVQHFVDGSKTISFSLKGSDYSGFDLIGSFNVSGSFKLPKMDRYSTFTIPSSVHYIGSRLSFAFENVDINFTRRLKYTIGTESNIINESSGQAYANGLSWLVPIAISEKDIYHDEIPCTITLTTIALNGSDEITIGEQTETIILTVPAGEPTTDGQIFDRNGYAYESKVGVYVKNMSRLCYNLYNLSGQYGAKIKNVDIILRKNNAEGEIITQESFSFPRSCVLNWTCNWVGTVYTKSVITDTRNRVSVYSSSAVVVEDYFAPKFTYSIGRYSEQEGITKDDGGNYSKVDYDASNYSFTGSNTAAVRIGYAESGSSEWINLTGNDESEGWSTVLTGSTPTFEADRNKTYDIRVEVKDKIQTVSDTSTLSTAITLMDWSENAISMGKTLSETKALEVGWGKIVIDDINGDNNNDSEVRFKRRSFNYQSSLWAPKQNDPGLCFCFKADEDKNWTYSCLATKTGFYPWHQGVENLGSSSKKWQTIYGNSIYGSTINGNTITGTTITGDTVNGNTIKENGTPLINKYAPIVSTVLNNGSLDWNNGSTVASGSWVTVGSYKFPVGRHLIITRVEFAGNASGNRQMMWTSSDTSTSAWTQQSYSTCAGHNGWTNLQSVFYANITTSESKYLRVVQSSGSALETYVYVQIIAI